MDSLSPYASPWSTLPLWQEANQTIAHTLRHHQGSLQPLVTLAGRIRERIGALDEPMEALCSLTCPQCREVCCRHANVYFDFKDLLYLHLGGGVLPYQQTMKKVHRTCSYLGADGCRFPRTERPFICTWYLCPDQRASLERSASSIRVFMHNSLEALKLGRKQLEAGYIQAITGATGG